MHRHLKRQTLSILALSTAASLVLSTPSFAQSGLQDLLNLGQRNSAEQPAAEVATDMAEETVMPTPVTPAPVARQADETGVFGLLTGQGAGARSTEAMGDDVDIQKQLEQRIDERLESIIERIASPQRAPVADELTVEDLDRIRREAQRADATRAMRESEFEEIQAELEMIAFLQTTLAEIRQTRTDTNMVSQAPEQEQVDVDQLRQQWEAEQAAAEAARQTNEPQLEMTPEQTLIPRLVSIRGAGGSYEAEIESARGVTQFVEPGDALADGFKVESIDPKGVVIEATNSGNRYSLIPSPPLNTQNTGATTNNIPVARDLGAGGGMF